MIRNGPFRLRKGSGFWQISHNGQTETVKREIGLNYLAYLMDHPFEKFQGLALTLKFAPLAKMRLNPTTSSRNGPSLSTMRNRRNACFSSRSNLNG
jgi:hypothetical protein